VTVEAGGGAPNLISLLIPIIIIIMGFGIGMLALWLDYCKKRDIFQLHHAERMAGIEKGIDVPSLPPEFFQSGNQLRTPYHFLRRGLLWLFLGLSGIPALYFQSEQHKQAWLALILVGWGIADLLIYAFERRRQVTEASGGSPQR